MHDRCDALLISGQMNVGAHFWTHFTDVFNGNLRFDARDVVLDNRWTAAVEDNDVRRFGLYWRGAATLAHSFVQKPPPR